MDHVIRATPPSGMSVAQSLTLDIACKHTKFSDSSFSHSRDF